MLISVYVCVCVCVGGGGGGGGGKGVVWPYIEQWAMGSIDDCIDGVKGHQITNYLSNRLD